MDDTFKRDEKLGIYFQLYNFEMDEQTKKPDGTIEYEIVKKRERTRTVIRIQRRSGDAAGRRVAGDGRETAAAEGSGSGRRIR